ncbi:uncharacterized protein LOC135814972 [Sycon ciliatum]|uniref:uncharacterized protein LOC135814972 n=1 Tax=Sycon ciliatum TaxID=27933 RepID=UPI0020AB8BA2|eukprot:scpid73222/ scgid20422/ 
MSTDGDISPTLAESWVNVDDERSHKSSAGAEPSYADGLHSDLSDGSEMEDMLAEAVRDSDMAADSEDTGPEQRHAEVPSPDHLLRSKTIPEELPLQETSSSTDVHRRTTSSATSLHSSAAWKESTSPPGEAPPSEPTDESSAESSFWYRIFSSNYARLIEFVSSHPNLVIAATFATIGVCIWRTRRIVFV